MRDRLTKPEGGSGVRTRMLGMLIAAVLAAEPVFAERDVPYVENATPLQKLDLFSDLTGNDKPVVVIVHGGGWRAGDKKSAANKVKTIAEEAGFVLVSVNYRLVPDGTWREQAADVAAALSWLSDHVAEYGGDPRRLYLVGHSAGAHLAALVTTDPSYLQRHDRKPADLAGVILLDGAGYDVAAQMTAVARRRGGWIYRSAFGEDPTEHEAASPTYHAAQHGGPPMLIAHVADRQDSAARSQALAEALRDAGGRAEVLPVAGTHSSIYRQFGLPGDTVSKAAHEFFRVATTPRR